jgi:hypothetical protein
VCATGARLVWCICTLCNAHSMDSVFLPVKWENTSRIMCKSLSAFGDLINPHSFCFHYFVCVSATLSVLVFIWSVPPLRRLSLPCPPSLLRPLWINSLVPLSRPDQCNRFWLCFGHPHGLSPSQGRTATSLFLILMTIYLSMALLFSQSI